MAGSDVVEITPSAVYVKKPVSGDNGDVVLIEIWDGRCYEVRLDTEDAARLAEELGRIATQGRS